MGAFIFAARALPHHFLVYISTIADNSQRQKSRGGVVSALDMAIASLNIAKEATNATPVNAVVRSVAILLTMIRVNSLPFRDEVFEAHTKTGHGSQQTGLYRPRAVLR